MTTKNNNSNPPAEQMGPQGTQVLDANLVNDMLAKQWIQEESSTCSVPALIGITEPFVGQQFRLTESKNKIGRKADNEIVVEEPSVSSSHAQIIKSEGEWKIMNLLSSNGTFVNEEKVVEHILSVGDKVRLGAAEFVFSFVEPDEDESIKSSSSMVSALGIGIVVIIAMLAALYFLL